MKRAKAGSYWRKKLNGLLRELVSLRDGERCLKCGKRSQLHMSHIYPKGRYRCMEFNPDNLKLLCVGCHLFWWHKNPIEASEWIKTALTPQRLKRLRRLSLETIKVDAEVQAGLLQKKIEALRLKNR